MEESDEIIELLLNGKADILFVPKFVEEGIRRHPEPCSLLVLPSPLCATFSEDSPLMKIKNLHVEDLKESSVLIDDNSSLYIQMLYRIFWEHGLVPNLKSIEPGENMKSKFLQLAREDIIITDRYHFSYHSNALEYRDLPDTESGIIMLFKQDAPPHVRKFLKYARKFFLDLGTARE